jgi:hypothetical protein
MNSIPLTIITVFAHLLCLVHSATGQELQPGALNLDYSRVFVFVDKSSSLGHQHAIEGTLKEGLLLIGQDKPGKLVFDVATFSADTDVARKYLALDGKTDEGTKEKVNANLLGAEILDAGRYPEALLSNATLKPSGATSSRGLQEYVLDGDFTLLKTTRRIQAKCDLELKDGWQHVRGSFRILQSDYGITPFRKMFGAIGVKDELIIYGDLWIAPGS